MWEYKTNKNYNKQLRHWSLFYNFKCVSGLGPSFMKIWTCGALREVGPEMPERESKTSTAPVFWATFGTFGAVQMISCRDWWPWTKPGYLTMTWRQSNNQCSGGIAAHTAQKIPSARIRWKNYRLDFFGIKTASSSLIIFQRAKFQRRVSLISAGANEGHFEAKTPREVTKGSCSGMKVPRLTGHLQPRKKWPTCASNVLITHPILRIWPRRTTTWSPDCKNNW